MSSDLRFVTQISGKMGRFGSWDLISSRASISEFIGSWELILKPRNNQHVRMHSITSILRFAVVGEIIFQVPLTSFCGQINVWNSIQNRPISGNMIRFGSWDLTSPRASISEIIQTVHAHAFDNVISGFAVVAKLYFKYRYRKLNTGTIFFYNRINVWNSFQNRPWCWHLRFLNTNPTATNSEQYSEVVKMSAMHTTKRIQSSSGDRKKK